MVYYFDQRVEGVSARLDTYYLRVIIREGYIDNEKGGRHGRALRSKGGAAPQMRRLLAFVSGSM
jgi:hypothetical protein